MKKILIGCLVLVSFASSCKQEAKIDRIKIAEEYYKMLDTSDDVGLVPLLADSILTKETEYNYEYTYAMKDYVQWLKWDAAFEPTYEVIEMVEENDEVKVRVSKIDKRIEFLHKEPIITNQILRFKNDKISSIETIKYVNFNDSLFVKNRDELVNWIDQYHPELNGFINDQTEVGGQKYLRAMDYFENERSLE
ncbi:hypothetical protein [Croceivirga thetidis]|uniref:Nuclear transport factor 2 family protein n=1 Tax=Croceivirga thetidis TaxID=2721623 RepID=A0ABX1GTT6_9FLAO|nr:hypothetical protein [Croceivirga thetidis]NKI33029.1 hypothetical protein [Croceivirga thetidis]